MEVSPERILDDLAIFPLPEVVLFPGSMVPLHVFEPRYVEMIRDVVAGTRLLAIVRLQDPSRAEEAQPPIYDVATVGRVVQCQSLPDDRYGIAVEGVARIQIDEELPFEKPYRRVVAHILEDEGSQDDTTVKRAELLAVCSKLASHMDEGRLEFQELLDQASASDDFSNTLGSVILTDPDDRQRLLELLGRGERLDFMCDHVATLLASLGPQSSAPN